MPAVSTATADVTRTPTKTGPSRAADAITADLVAVLVAVTDGDPKIMTIAGGSALPSGPFEFTHRSLQTGLRAWVEAQTGHPLGYLEQLYTFADRGGRSVTLRPEGTAGVMRAVIEHGLDRVPQMGLLLL